MLLVLALVLAGVVAGVSATRPWLAGTAWYWGSAFIVALAIDGFFGCLFWAAFS